MKSWTVRGRIIAAFAMIIAIMAVLGTVSFVQLRDIKRQAAVLEADVLPGVLLSSQTNATAKGLLADVIVQAQEAEVSARERAHAVVDRALADAARIEQLYKGTIASEDDLRLFNAITAARTRFAELYAASMADKILD
ncbi:MAG: MCP four helix bundle domain-containing protein, partial [bacterium]